VRETVRLIERATALGYRAALVSAPHSYPNLLNTAASQTLFFGAVADQARIPLILDNSPATSGVEIAAETVARLSAHPNILAVLEGSGDVERMARMIAETKPGFQVLAGAAQTLAGALAAGAVGAVLDYANAAPYTAIAIWEAHRQRGVRRRSGLAAAQRAGGRAGDGPIRHPGAEVRHGPERVLRRPGAAATHHRGAGSEAGDRGGVPGSEGLRRGARSRMGKKKEIIEIKIDRLKLMRIPGGAAGAAS
jgi:hypothetical protein